MIDIPGADCKVMFGTPLPPPKIREAMEPGEKKPSG